MLWVLGAGGVLSPLYLVKAEDQTFTFEGSTYTSTRASDTKQMNLTRALTWEVVRQNLRDHGESISLAAMQRHLLY